MSDSAETLVSKSTQLVYSARGMLEKLSPQAVAAIALCGAAGLVVLFWSRRRRFPPGDFSLPFVGPRNIGAPCTRTAQYSVRSPILYTVYSVHQSNAALALGDRLALIRTMCTRTSTFTRMYAREGSLPFLTFIEWSKRYKSDIVGFRVWPGIVNVVVCNTFASIREVLAGKEADALSGRVKSQLATLHNPDGLGAPTLTHWPLGPNFSPVPAPNPLESLGETMPCVCACVLDLFWLGAR